MVVNRSSGPMMIPRCNRCPPCYRAMATGTVDAEGVSLAQTTHRGTFWTWLKNCFPEDQNSEVESSDFSASLLSGGSGDDHSETDDGVVVVEDLMQA